MEAEHFTSQNGFLTLTRSDASGNKVVQISSSGAKVNYEINVTQGGSWYLWIRTYASGSANNGMYVELNGAKINNGSVSDIYLKKGVWSWEPEWLFGESSHQGPIRVNINSGKHTLSIIQRKSERPYIDKIILTKSATPPTGFGEAETISSSGGTTTPTDEIASSNGYSIKQLVSVSNYLWFMASVDNILYSGSYTSTSDPQYYYYSSAPYTSWSSKKISDDDESSRVYNLNGKFYATTEGGSNGAGGRVLLNGNQCYKFPTGTGYVLGAEYFSGKYLISRSEGNKTRIYSCPCSGGQTCSVWASIDNIFTFHIKEFNGNLYLIGTSPSEYRTNSGGRVYAINNSGVLVKSVINSGPGSGVRAEVFDEKIFFGFSYNAEIKSYTSSGALVNEKSFLGIEHFGDFEIFDNKLFVSVVKEGGSPEIWYRQKDSDGGQWINIFSQSQLNKYGVRGNLVNGAGFFTTLGDKLYYNINNKTCSRCGPGYILEISKPLPACIQSTDWNYIDGFCQATNKKTRTWTKIGNCTGGFSPTSNPQLIDCIYVPPVLTCTSSDWSYTDGDCGSDGKKIRTYTKKTNCVDGETYPPTQEVDCTYTPTCDSTHWESSEGSCQSNGKLIRAWKKIGVCKDGETHPTTEQIDCEYIEACTTDNWESIDQNCNSNGKTTRTWTQVGVCNGGITHPKTEEISCTYLAPNCIYEYSDWSECSVQGIKIRIANPINSPCNGSPEHTSTTCSPCLETNYPFTLEPIECPQSGVQTKKYYKTEEECTGGLTQPQDETITCIPIPLISTDTNNTSTNIIDINLNTNLTNTNQIDTNQDINTIDSNLPITPQINEEEGEEEICTNTKCGDGCYTGKGICCNNNWNKDLDSCEFNYDTEIEIINSSQDTEAGELLGESLSYAEKGEINKANAYKNLALIKSKITLLGNTPELTEMYEQAKVALDQENYEELELIIDELENEKAEENFVEKYGLQIGLIVFSIIITISIIQLKKRKII